MKKYSWLKDGCARLHMIGIAEMLLAQNSPYTDGICFHAQQSTEKVMKAALVYLNVPFKRTHNLTYLADLLSDYILVSNEIYEKLEQLEDYAVEIRYPDAMIDPTREDAIEAVDCAKHINEFVMDALLQKDYILVISNCFLLAGGQVGVGTVR